MTVTEAERDALKARLGDRRWRLDTLYKITDARGQIVPFRMNWAQTELYEQLWPMNVILKARQLGLSTFIQLLMLDACLFRENIQAGVIADRRDTAEAIFQTKIRFAYQNLPKALRRAIPATTERVNEIRFANGSSIRVDTSHRGGTLQWLHISEYGKIAATRPDRAREIRTGALNTVHAGQTVFVESTAEGQDGAFYELCAAARRQQDEGRALGPMDFRFHFFPWWRHPDYVLNDPTAVTVAADEARYFERLEAKCAITLHPGQRAWYVAKKRIQGEEMRREFPSTPDEAFANATEGAYFAEEMRQVRRQGRILSRPVDQTAPVFTFWDIGVDDYTAIWFLQTDGPWFDFVDYYENNGEGVQHYAQMLRERGYVYGEHYFPHDVDTREWISGKSRRETLLSLGVRPLRVVPRTANLADDIQAMRNRLAQCRFDGARCARGLTALDRYRKDWDDQRGVFRDRPRHDAASHGADAFRCFAVAFRPPSGDPRPDFAENRWSLDGATA